MDPSDPPITEVAPGEACHYHRSLRLGPQSHFQICLSGYQKLSSARRSLPQLCFWKKSFGRWLQHLPNVFAAAQHVVGLVPCKTQTRFYTLAPTLRMRIRPDFFAQNYRPAFFFFKNTVNTVHNVSLWTWATSYKMYNFEPQFCFWFCFSWRPWKPSR